MKNWFLAGVVATISAAITPSVEAEGVKLYTLSCGEVEMLNLGIFARGGEFDGRQNSASDACFFIRHPKGDLLWDTGLPKAIAQLPDGQKGPAFHLKVPVTLEEQLNEIGVSPSDIEYVSVSHSHFDHTGNLNDYAGSTWIVHENEYAAMFSDQTRANTQLFSYFNEMEQAEKITFSGDYDVFGDGSVMILSMPGHTPGHSSLLVNLDKAGSVMLSGDLYHLTEARERRTVPTFNTNAEDTLTSMDRFEALAKEKGARVVIQHEKADVGKMPKFPAYLD